MPERDKQFLSELQAMPMHDKFNRTLGLIGEWHNYYHHNVYVSLSGGKDSTVLADIDAKWCKAIGQPLNLVFSNTGLEYPEIQQHVRKLKPYFESKYGIEVNLTIVRPKMQFPEVISKYGYPIIGKEVAEAIYYARRISNAPSKETVRQRKRLHAKDRIHTKRDELLDERTIGSSEKASFFNKKKVASIVGTNTFLYFRLLLLQNEEIS